MVWPANLGAFENGLRAIKFEENVDVTTATKHWQLANTLLENELKKYRGSGSTGTVQFQQYGFSGGKMFNVI